MIRAPRLCQCGQIVPAGVTCECQTAAKRVRGRRHDARRPNSTARGYDRRWQRLRAEFLHHHPFCRFCSAEATVVDHRAPHRGDKALFWNTANLQSLCAPCHDRTKQRLERAGA